VLSDGGILLFPTPFIAIVTDDLGLLPVLGRFENDRLNCVIPEDQVCAKYSSIYSNDNTG
jgi:hypothetical protein